MRNGNTASEDPHSDLTSCLIAAATTDPLHFAARKACFRESRWKKPAASADIAEPAIMCSSCARSRAPRSLVHMIISLSLEQEILVRAKVDSGEYDSWAQVIREALILLEERDQIRDLRKERLLLEIAVGINQANSRQLVDGLEVFRRLRSKASEHAE